MERNTDPDTMHLSSVDEQKGIQPITRAVELVRQQIQENARETRDRWLREDELPTIYVVTFTYILGGWKAMVSTSWSDGHYYEVTYNAQKLETYIDRYSKDYNVCVVDPDDVEERVRRQQLEERGTSPW